LSRISQRHRYHTYRTTMMRRFSRAKLPRTGRISSRWCATSMEYDTATPTTTVIKTSRLFDAKVQARHNFRKSPMAQPKGFPALMTTWFNLDARHAAHVDFSSALNKDELRSFCDELPEDPYTPGRWRCNSWVTRDKRGQFVRLPYARMCQSSDYNSASDMGDVKREY